MMPCEERGVHPDLIIKEAVAEIESLKLKNSSLYYALLWLVKSHKDTDCNGSSPLFPDALENAKRVLNEQPTPKAKPGQVECPFCGREFDLP